MTGPSSVRPFWGRVKWGVWLVLGIALVVWWIQNQSEKERIRNAERVEIQRIELSIRQSVETLVDNHGANQSWPMVLSKGESYRLQPVLTLELERLWINGGPILFLGLVQDIATVDDESYIITIGQSIAGNHTFGTDLRLALHADRRIIDDFLTEYPQLFEDYRFNNGVAVVTKITSIKASQIAGEGGYIVDVKTGTGDLLGIVYTSNVRF